MSLKVVVEKILKENNRSMAWLATEMSKSADGLRLSLVRESIKFNDLQKMSVILGVPPATFFQNTKHPYPEVRSAIKTAESDGEYADLKSNLKNCREMVNTLKDQLKDKEKIISLLSKS